jgi:uncharacterized protein with GYD domain
MPFFMVQAAYSSTSWAAMVKSPEDREKAFRQLVEKAGCKLVTFYFCFGENDVVAILEAPDNATAAVIAITASGTGHLRNYTTTPLLTVEETIGIMRKAGDISASKPPKA